MKNQLNKKAELTQAGKITLKHLENARVVVDVFCNRDTRHYSTSDKVVLMQTVVSITQISEFGKLLKQIKENLIND